jgi:hypothetical protein
MPLHRSAAYLAINADADLESDRRGYHERRRLLKQDPAAYKAFKLKKAAYMKQYRANRKAKEAEQNPPAGT